MASFQLAMFITAGAPFYSSEKVFKKSQAVTHESLADQVVKFGNKNRPGQVTLMEVVKNRETAAAFEELAMPLFDQLYNFARWLTRDPAEAEDLVQETYVKALRGFSSFQLGTNFRAWIYRILHNTFLTSRTGLKATHTVALDLEEAVEVPSGQATPEAILIDRSQQETLQAALDEIPAPYREILLLCEVEEMSYKEIAEVLAIPIGTVMSRLSRARSALRGSLKEKMAKV